MTAAIHFEVKKHAVRQTADGWVVSFVVHPNDMDSAFAVSPLGTRYMLAVAQIGDDEQPISPAGPQPQTKGLVAIGNSPGKDTPKQPAGETHKTPAERAVIRAAILCSEPRFRIWMAGEDISTTAAAQMLREACGVESRADIGKDPDALDRFVKLETEYLIEIGAMAAPR
jgi:hypothetical protein